jgi:hypothetical protein
MITMRRTGFLSRGTGLPLGLGVGVAAAALLAALPGCSQDDVTRARVPKVASSAIPPGAGPGGMPVAGIPGAPGGGVEAPPVPQGGSALAWTLPKGWTETGASAMRYATLKPPLEGKIDVSVVVLPGPAGGELANVNRWRNQIGLPPIDEAALGAARKATRSNAGPVSVYDFTSDGQTKSRMIAGLLSVGGSTWFVKMVGDAGPVGAAKPDFTRLLESLRLAKAD